MSERTRTEEELQTRAALIDLALEAIFVRSMDDSSVLFWSRGAQEMYGWSREEAMGKISHELLKTKFPQSLAEIEAAVIQSGRWDGELVQTDRDGTRVVVASRWALHRDDAGRPAGILEVNSDVSEQKRVENALRQLNADLERRIRERTVELEAALEERDRLLAREQEARSQAEGALQVRDEFLSVASHELKTPLTVLQMQLQYLTRLLRREVGNEHLPERLWAILERGENQIKRLTRLNTELLDVSRLALGEFHLNVEEVDLAELVQEAVANFLDMQAGGDSPIQMKAAEPMVGHWDRSRLDQVVTNLLSNAVKFGRRQPVEVGLEREDTRARITVRDAGIGIPPEHLERIFDRFGRAASVQLYAGLGLGLYIARRIVEAHGGSITVTSQPDVGSTFTVELPLESE